METQQRFDKLTQQERKALRKEFNKIVEKRFRIFFAVGIVLLFAAIVCGAVAIYYIINILIQGVVAKELYIFAIIFTAGCFISLLLTSTYNKKFSAWLKEEKNIIR